MKNYNDEYYIVLDDFNDNTLYVSAQQKSADRCFGYKKLILGQEPLFFENSYKEEDKQSGTTYNLPSIMLRGTIPIINNHIRDRLKFLDFVDMQLYPAVYIDDEDKYHENYWCMNFWGRLDCLDRTKSVLSKFGQKKLLANPLADDLPVKQYHLSTGVLNKIPEEDRLIFKIGGDNIGYVFIHQKIADIFNEENVSGIKLFKVSEYKKGMQFK